MARILDFQNVLSWVSSGVIRSACNIPSDTIHPSPSWSPLGLFPGTLMSTTALTSLFSSILCMCPYQRSRISFTFSCILVTYLIAVHKAEMHRLLFSRLSTKFCIFFPRFPHAYYIISSYLCMCSLPGCFH